MSDAVRLLLTNKTGGYALLGDKPLSRFEGVFFAAKGQVLKTIESLKFDVPAERLTNRLWCVERQRGQVTERLIMPEGKDVFLLDLSAPMEFTVILDVKQSYDNRVWGREYDITAEKGCVVFSFKKKTDSRDDNKAFHEEFECHLAVCATPLDYIPIKQWEEHSYSIDNSRGSSPDSRWVYVGAKMKASRAAFGFGLSKSDAIRNARDTLSRASKIMDAEEKRVCALTGNELFRSDEVEVARKCAVHALDSLSVNEEGIYAGLPWFFQFWARDELISIKGLLLAGKSDLAKKILFRHLARLKDGRLLSHSTANLAAADAPGWLFFRLEDLCLHDDTLTKKILSAAERKEITRKLLEYLDITQRYRLQDGLIPNGPQETWMDTVWENDTRSGARIEIQALALANCRFYNYLTGNKHTLEKGLRQLTREEFVKKNVIYDGKGDPTARPNAFIAAYVYPELFSKTEWSTYLSALLPKLWLAWGGLSSIDVKHSLFTSRYTGENNKSYHRGDSWFWLNNIAAIVLQRTDKTKFERHINKIVNASTHELLHMGASGYSAEVSSAEQLRSEGCVAQTWSVATLLELLHERYE